MGIPSELNRAPAMWVPSGKRGVLVKLPYDADNRAANPTWLRNILGDRIKMGRGPNGTWEIARSHADSVEGKPAGDAA